MAVSYNPIPEVALLLVLLVIVGPLLLIVAAVLLAVPAYRCRTGLRRTGYVSLFLSLCLLIPLAVLVVMSL